MGKQLIQHNQIEQMVLMIRGMKVILDRDLAALYGVDTKRLKEQVRRNIERFPDDFMFVLSAEEYSVLRSQIATSSSWGGSRYTPMAFTEQGVAMLSSVLNNKRAIDVNIAIMRTFVKLRSMLEEHALLAKKLAEMESKYDKQFSVVFDVLKELVNEPETDRKKIGFSAKEELAKYSSERKTTDEEKMPKSGKRKK